MVWVYVMFQLDEKNKIDYTESIRKKYIFTQKLMSVVQTEE